ncbi:MAG: AAA family ATPase [Pseudomonadota bacterium]
MVNTIANKIRTKSASFIFYGPKGVGKKHAVMDIAKTVMCDKTPYCGACDNCRRIDNGEHPNIIFLRPKEKDITIKDVRGMLDTLQFSPAEEGNRFIIIDDAHRLNNSSANALLKALEEPPKDTALFLITPNLHKMLPTIISRCELIHVPPIKDDKLACIMNISGSHELLPYAMGSAAKLKFYLENQEEIKDLLSFVQSPKNSYPEINRISDNLMNIIEGAEEEEENKKVVELENFEYVTSLILFELMKDKDDTPLQCLNNVQETAKRIYNNTPASIVMENMLLELAKR